MTVCLAAMNKKHNIVAFGSDRMVTSSYPPIEFEHKIPKIIEISEYCVVLSAGDALRNKELCKIAIADLSGKQASIEDIAQKLKSVYQQERLRAVEDVALKSRGITHEQFVKDGTKIFPLQIYQMIDQFATTFNFNLDLIVAGLDEQGPAIYGIHNPGVINSYDSIGFHTIGNGSMHGMLSLVDTYDPDSGKAEMLYSVFRAKKVAEVAPGVGKNTDLGMISRKEKIKYFDENADFFKYMDGLLEKERIERNALITKAKLATMDISGVGKAAAETDSNGGVK